MPIRPESGSPSGSLADSVIWRFDAPSLIPYAGEYKTPNQVKEGFFGSLASTQKDYALKADEFIAQGDKVIMVGSYGATVNATGKRFDLPLVHVWTIRDGQIERFLNFTDTAKLAEAYSIESA
jgi:ketosteroid isomerase-like protein